MAEGKTLAAIIAPIVAALIAIGLGVAYQQGTLDPIIEKIGIYLFKAKAKAEEKELQAEGKKEGEDFLASSWSYPAAAFWFCLLTLFVCAGELKGNKQASQVTQGFGGMDSLKKGF